MKISEFNSSVLPIQQKIFRLSKRLLTSSDAAEDASQEVMIKLWNKRHELNEINNIEAFAMTITKNHCLDQLKLKANQNLRLVHTNYENKSADPQKQLEAKQELNTVEAMIKTLPETQRLVLHLRQIEGYEYDKICEIMDMKPKAVRVTLSRARKNLVERISKQHQNENRA
ncbi:RNA polymerase sigma factor [Mesohalobacter halotolerans]|uniref:RNA polymerase sigma factor n=1 Tax=Mesohalobacter halotolerans TaxID=1883405 RepID=A0A4U5TQP7_9FLAO|nr:RNA polymerase sigma factor [Mesohalobacter halotolerans]MBS3738948.1 RNA polymerase sigma factor [Psychroflexus sp.]TKS56373.1 RNA polymerase sigma factor [Mesohalobacter halotolerans]